MTLSEEVRVLLGQCLDDFRTVNGSGLWSGHPFDWRVDDLEYALTVIPERIAAMEAVVEAAREWQEQFRAAKAVWLPDTDDPKRGAYARMDAALAALDGEA